MFKIAFVVFREGMEIALMLGIILAVTKRIYKSRVDIITGVILGVILASLFAFFIRSLALYWQDVEEEIFNTIIMLMTVIMISWTITWMNGYGTKVRQRFNNLSEKIHNNTASRIMLTLFVTTSLFREGVEIILLIYGITVSSNGSINHTSYLIGFLGGAFSGILLGSLIYLGLIKFAGKYIFKISEIMLLLIAAGLASEAAGLLTSSGIITMFSEQVWDSSWLVDDKSILGDMLRVILGYNAKPNILQFMFYISTIVFIQMLKILNKLYEKQVGSNI